MENAHRYKCPKCGSPMLWDSSEINDIKYVCHRCKVIMSHNNMAVYYPEDDLEVMNNLENATVIARAPLRLVSSIADVIVTNDNASRETQKLISLPTSRLLMYDGVYTLGFVERLLADQILRRTAQWSEYHQNIMQFKTIGEFIDNRRMCTLQNARYDMVIGRCIYSELRSFETRNEVRTCVNALLAPLMEMSLQILTKFITLPSILDSDVSLFTAMTRHTNTMYTYGTLTVPGMTKEMFDSIVHKRNGEWQIPLDNLKAYQKFVADDYIGLLYFVTPRFEIVPGMDGNLQVFSKPGMLGKVSTRLALCKKLIPANFIKTTANRAVSQYPTEDNSKYWYSAVEDLNKKMKWFG